MTRLFGQDWTRAALLERIGDVSQVGGARLIRFAEGPETGVLAAQIRTGSGFAFTVLPDRGMDIGYAEYRGMPLCWRSSTGEIQAAMYEPQDQGWLRGFSGGLMATCGLTQAGWVSTTEDGAPLGLHGRASYLQARGVHVDGAWDGDDYVMWVQGKTRDTVVYGENLQLTRRVWARLGENRLFVDDVVENLGHERVPHMLAYHVNGGFPILDDGGELVSTLMASNPCPMTATTRSPTTRRTAVPTGLVSERPVAPTRNPTATAGRRRRCSIAAWVSDCTSNKSPTSCPFCGNGNSPARAPTSPASSRPIARVAASPTIARNGTLQFLEPGERRAYNVEIGVLEL